MKSNRNFHFYAQMNKKNLRFFKALMAKLKIELIGSNQIRKTILEMYIREKEEEYFKQHEQEFFDNPVL